MNISRATTKQCLSCSFAGKSKKNYSAPKCCSQLPARGCMRGIATASIDRSLPEFGSLPSAIFFAECFFSGTRQRSSLPSVTQKTLGKIKHSAKKLFAECFILDTRQRVSLPSVFF
jgi:hypothetical protein